MAYVRASSPGHPPKVVSLIKDVVVFGRSAQCDIPVADDNTSRQHCQIRKWAGKYVVEDLQSKNGTYVNGSKVVKEHALADGDLITIGDTTILFKSEK
jgi:pSer/pThr/pTyr-binding forkhead associated (FHA) protein